jgi:hydrogenase-4 component B
MNLQPDTLLIASLAGYAIGAVAGLLFLRKEKAANLFAFGCASLAGLCGVVSCVAALSTGAAAANQSFALFPSLIPYVQFTVRFDPLAAFFGLIVSLLGLALSVYSLGYARGFYGRKNVGALGALFNLLLLTTTLVFLSANAFFFLIAWEIMALSAYCLVSFEHEHEETRNAGVLYFVMSHIGTGCLILGFLLLFQTSGNYGFDGFHALGEKMSTGKRNAVFLLFLFGFGIKAGIVPVHIWLPVAHPVAP